MTPSVSMLAMVYNKGFSVTYIVCVYLYELLLRLKCSGLGCHVGNVSVPVVSYADDISLTAPTVSSLKCMLNIIKYYGQEYCVRVNPHKSKLIVLGKVYNCHININFDGYAISQTDYADHPGHVIGAISGVKCLAKICSDIILRTKALGEHRPPPREHIS